MGDVERADHHGLFLKAMGYDGLTAIQFLQNVAEFQQLIEA